MTRVGADEIEALILEVFESAVALRRHGEVLAAAGSQTYARFQLLGMLENRDATVPQLARSLGLTRQSVQRVADVLQAQGLLVTLPNPAHARSPLLRSTEAGRAACQPIVDAAREAHSATALLLDAADVAVAMRVLQILAQEAQAVLDEEEPPT